MTHPGTMATAYSMAEAMPATRDLEKRVLRKYANASNAAAVSHSSASISTGSVCGKGYSAIAAHSAPDSAIVAKCVSAHALQYAASCMAITVLITF